MTYLFCDVETSGLIKKHLPLDSAEQPWIVSLAAELTDHTGDHIACINTTIRANGRTITADAARVHGISSALAGRTGVSELAALGVLCGRESLASQARYVIGHGVSFDRDVITSVLLRQKRDPASWTRPGLEFLDTMLAATPFCRLPSDHADGGFKWPTLDEACQILLDEEPRSGARDAWDDLRRTKRVFFWLRSRNAIDLAEAA